MKYYYWKKGGIFPNLSKRFFCGGWVRYNKVDKGIEEFNYAHAWKFQNFKKNLKCVCADLEQRVLDVSEGYRFVLIEQMADVSK